MRVILKGYKVSELQFVSKLENGTRVELGNRYSYNVSYAPNNTCRGEFSIAVEDKENPDKFGIKLVLIGFFEFEEGVEKERVHVHSFKELFPYARAIVTTVTANSGIAPMILPPIDIESQDIYRFEKNN
ncbi:MAG: protein-export chaperone SecB [Clostridia bacterium]|nr:protein-export chaperone SecB [Clostridia bacterium]